MDKHDSTVAERVAEAVGAFQKQSTGHTPRKVTVVLSEDTLVITLDEALTPAEKALARSAEGAAKVQEFHRQLFETSFESLRQDIKRITGRDVLEGIAEVKQASGAIAHAFTTGTMVQVFLLTPSTQSQF